MIHTSWVERATDRKLTEGQARCIDVLCSTDRPYNLPLINTGWYSAVDYSLGRPNPNPLDDEAQECDPTPAVEFHPGFVHARMNGTMSTFDCSRLTDIVIAAHEKLVRVEFSATHYVYQYSDMVYYERDIDGHYVETGKYIRGWSTCMEIHLSPREAEGSLYARHPDLDGLIAKIKDRQ